MVRLVLVVPLPRLALRRKCRAMGAELVALLCGHLVRLVLRQRVATPTASATATSSRAQLRCDWGHQLWCRYWRMHESGEYI